MNGLAASRPAYAANGGAPFIAQKAWPA